MCTEYDLGSVVVVNGVIWWPLCYYTAQKLVNATILTLTVLAVGCLAQGTVWQDASLGSLVAQYLTDGFGQGHGSYGCVLVRVAGWGHCGMPVSGD